MYSSLRPNLCPTRLNFFFFPVRKGRKELSHDEEMYQFSPSFFFDSFLQVRLYPFCTDIPSLFFVVGKGTDRGRSGFGGLRIPTKGVLTRKKISVYYYW